MEEKINWMVTKETDYQSFVSAKKMSIERAKVEGIQKVAEILLEQNKLLDQRNKQLEDQNTYLLGVNEKLKIVVDEIGFIRAAMVHS
jgi:hypothetical protein